jgi:hypothetical protein
MYISEIKLRKIIRQELLREGTFDDVVDWASKNTIAGAAVKSAHDYYHDTLGGAEVGRLPWENSHSDIIKLSYMGICFFGPDEKNAVPASLIGKMNKENNFIILVDPKAKIPEKQKSWFDEKRRSSEHEKYAWNAMKKLYPEVTNNAWTKEDGIKDQLEKGNVYYAASTKSLYYPLSQDEKAGIAKFMRNTGIEVTSNALGLTAAIISPVNPVAGAALEMLSAPFGIADVINKLEDKDFYSVVWGLIGLIPGGDVLNVFSKVTDELSVVAPIADELAGFVLGLIGSEYDSIFGMLCAHYFGDHEGEEGYDPDKLSKDERDSILPITKTIIDIASNIYEGVAKKLKEEGKEQEAKKYVAKANKAKSINAAEATKKVIAKSVKT